jgi:hypothetical protein
MYYKWDIGGIPLDDRSGETYYLFGIISLFLDTGWTQGIGAGST